MSPAAASSGPIYTAKASSSLIYTAKASSALGNSPVVKAVTLSKNPLGYWRCDETSGTTAKDSSGNARDLTLTGGVTQGIFPALPGDPADAAMSFDGSTGFLTGVGTGLNIAGPLSVGIWVNATTLNHAGGGSNPTPIEKTSGGGSNYRIFVPSNGSVTFRVNGLSIQDLTSAAGLVPLATWTHIVCTWDGSVKKTYVNAVLKATSGALTGAPLANAGAMFIGKSSAATRNWDGPLKDGFAAAGALSPADVSDIYLAGKQAMGALATASSSRS